MHKSLANERGSRHVGRLSWRQDIAIATSRICCLTTSSHHLAEVVRRRDTPPESPTRQMTLTSPTASLHANRTEVSAHRLPKNQQHFNPPKEQFSAMMVTSGKSTTPPTGRHTITTPPARKALGEIQELKDHQRSSHSMCAVGISRRNIAHRNNFPRRDQGPRRSQCQSQVELLLPRRLPSRRPKVQKMRREIFCLSV